MSEEFGPDFVTISDEDGREFVMEILDSFEHNGTIYYAMVQAESLDDETGDSSGSEDAETEMILMKVIEEDDEEILSTLDTDEEAEEIYNLFMERIFAEDDEDDEDE